jgi:hypothetical protein
MKKLTIFLELEYSQGAATIHLKDLEGTTNKLLSLFAPGIDDFTMPLMAVVSKEGAVTSLSQFGYFYAGVMPVATACLNSLGYQFDEYQAEEFFKQMYFFEIVQVGHLDFKLPRHKGQATRLEMAEFCDKIALFCGEHGYTIESPEDYKARINLKAVMK